jgi:hypothetical protein
VFARQAGFAALGLPLMVVARGCRAVWKLLAWP